jgi:hypothetical protein
MGEAAPPFRLFDPKTMSKDLGALQYHPGAVKFYREAGIWKGR